MSLLHECKDSHDRDFATRIQHRRNARIHSANPLHTTQPEINELDDDDESASLIHHLNMIESCFSERNNFMRANAIDTITHADEGGIFTVSDDVLDIDSEGTIQLIDIDQNEASNNETQWKDEYDNRKKNWKSNAVIPSSTNSTCHGVQSSARVSTVELGSINSSSNMFLPHLNPLIYSLTSTAETPSIDSETIAHKWTLNTEQYRAYRIIVDHASDFMKKKPI